MIKIRKGVKEDLNQVLKLIKDLAKYENALNEVSIQLHDLERDGFGERPLYWIQIAEINNRIVGIAIYYIAYSTWKGKCLFLEDFIVAKRYRNMGVGKKLFESIVLIAKKRI